MHSNVYTYGGSIHIYSTVTYLTYIFLPNLYGGQKINDSMCVRMAG